MLKNPVTAPAPTRYPFLDLLRFASALWVMNFHYLADSSGDLHWYRYGHLGAQMFFIISGFAIVYSLRATTFRDFALGRFIRLFPLFWLMCTATYVFTLLTTRSPVSFGEYLATMTMIGPRAVALGQGWRLVDPSYWSLEVELMFYVAIAIVVFALSHERLRYFFASWLMLSIALFLSDADHTALGRLALVRHAPYFAFGGTLALIVMRQANAFHQTCVDYAVLLLSAAWATSIYARAFPSPYDVPNALDTTVIRWLHVLIFASVIPLVWASSFVQKTRAIRRLGILGGITYPLYLVHQTIGNTISGYLIDTYGTPRGLIALCIEALMIGIAYGTYRKDQQFRAWLQGRLHRRSAGERQIVRPDCRLVTPLLRP